MSEYPIALQKMSADKKYRLTVHYDECVIHPLRTCDFPLHMDDWDRGYSARPYAHSRKRDNDDHYGSREECMRYLLRYYGDEKKIIDLLVANGKKQQHERYECALIYDRSGKEWAVSKWQPAWKGYDGMVHEAHWEEEYHLALKREYIRLDDVIDNLEEDFMAECINRYLTDGVKVMSYSFGYHGDIDFFSEVDAKSDGIAWIEKSEAVGEGKWLSEDQWATQDCYALTKGEREEICAWARGDCFCFEVEKNVRWKVHRECLSEERPTEDYETDEWEQVDTCSGFYGIDHCVSCAIEENSLPPMIEAA